MKNCLHQFIRPKIYVRLAGVGNCLTCQPHPDNKKCKEYCEISVKEVEICDAKPADM